MKRVFSNPFIVIAAFVSLVFMRNLAFWSPSQTFIFGDTAIYALQLTTLAKNLGTIFRLKDSIFLWNPNYLSVGIPSLSVVDMGWLYPPNWIVAFTAWITGNPLNVFPLYTLSILLHITVSAYFVYLLLKRHWNLTEYYALIGAFIWVFSGFVAEFSAAAPIMIAGSYLPLCLYLTMKSATTKSVPAYLLFFIFTAFSFLIGYPMVSILVYAFCVLFRFFLKPEITKATIIKELKYHALGLATITLPIISPLYFQSFLNLGSTVRASLNLEGFLQNPTPLLNIPEPLLPKNTFFNTLDRVNQIFLYFSLVGVVLLLQSGLNKSFFSDKKNTIILLLGLNGLIISLGAVTFLPSLLYYSLPFLNVFRRLSVFTVVPSFCFSIIVAQLAKSALESKSLSKALIFWVKVVALLIVYSQVLNILYSDLKDQNPFNSTNLYQSIFLTALITGLTITALVYKSLNLRLAKIILVIALLTEAGTVVSSKFYLNSKIDPSRILRPSAVISAIKKQIKPMERVDLVGTPQHTYSTDFLNLEQVQGYTSMASQYGVAIDGALNGSPNYDKTNLIKILGIAYFVGKGENDYSGLTKIGSFKQSVEVKNQEFFTFNDVASAWEPVPPGTAYSIYGIANVFPRAYLAAGIRETESQSKEILEAIGKLSDPKTVFINTKDVQSVNIAPGQVEILEYSRNYLKIKTVSDGVSFLANSTGYYPGWELRVNGERKKPIEVNWFMLGSYLPKGENIVEFFYLPYGLIAGLLYFTLAILGWLLFRLKLFPRDI